MNVIADWWSILFHTLIYYVMELKFVEVDEMDYDYQNGFLEVYQQISVPLLE